MRLLPFLAAAAALLPSVAAAQDADFRLSGPARQGALLRGTAPPGTVALDMNGRPVPLGQDGRFILGFDRDGPYRDHAFDGQIKPAPVDFSFS